MALVENCLDTFAIPVRFALLRAATGASVVILLFECVKIGTDFSAFMSEAGVRLFKCLKQIFTRIKFFRDDIAARPTFDVPTFLSTKVSGLLDIINFWIKLSYDFGQLLLCDDLTVGVTATQCNKNNCVFCECGLL